MNNPCYVITASARSGFRGQAARGGVENGGINSLTVSRASTGALAQISVSFPIALRASDVVVAIRGSPRPRILISRPESDAAVIHPSVCAAGGRATRGEADV